MRPMIFAANWKMQLGPEGARRFLHSFLERHEALPDRETWFFPSAVALATVARLTGDRRDIRTGAQAGLVGHSERRHVFGETDQETGRKVRALLESDLTPMLCVGEKIEQREAGETLGVVQRQLSALDGLGPDALAQTIVAYEPVWAIGTGKTATPEDAAEVHAAIRGWFTQRGVAPETTRVLYGGSVKPDNIQALISQPEIDGVLVGGASLDPTSWSEIVRVTLD